MNSDRGYSSVGCCVVLLLLVLFAAASCAVEWVSVLSLAAGGLG